MTTLAETIREELRKGSYQMPGDTLPYETQAAAVARALQPYIASQQAAALRAAAEDLARLPYSPTRVEYYGWLKARAAYIEAADQL